MDIVTPEVRSRIMSRIRSKDTKPEMTVRRLIHSLGYRFRLHRRDLPGTPDMVFPGRKAVIFVNGCFWHGHDCGRGKLPKSNVRFWRKKFRDNSARDEKNIAALRANGWRVLVVWECEMICGDPGHGLNKILARKLTGFLDRNKFFIMRKKLPKKRN